MKIFLCSALSLISVALSSEPARHIDPKAEPAAAGAPREHSIIPSGKRALTDLQKFQAEINELALETPVPKLKIDAVQLKWKELSKASDQARESLNAEIKAINPTVIKTATALQRLLAEKATLDALIASTVVAGQRRDEDKGRGFDQIAQEQLPELKHNQKLLEQKILAANEQYARAQRKFGQNPLTLDQLEIAVLAEEIRLLQEEIDSQVKNFGSKNQKENE